jgi:glutathione S-transferase
MKRTPCHPLWPSAEPESRFERERLDILEPGNGEMAADGADPIGERLKGSMPQLQNRSECAMTEPRLKLYHGSPSRSSMVLWMLEELGEPYDLALLNLKAGEHLLPAYLAINPMGKVPTLIDDGVAITEVAAICCHLADKYPKAVLAPPINDPRRGPYLKWLFWGPSCFEPAVIDHHLKRQPGPRAMMGWIDYKTTLDVLEQGLTPGPYLMGEQFTAADVVLGAGVMWGMMFGTVEKRPAFEAYAARLSARPAVKRYQARDAALAKPQ